MRTKKCKRKTLLARSERKKKVALVSGKKKKDPSLIYSYHLPTSHFNCNYSIIPTVHLYKIVFFPAVAL